jgi:hypothetical protein
MSELSELSSSTSNETSSSLYMSDIRKETQEEDKMSVDTRESTSPLYPNLSTLQDIPSDDEPVPFTWNTLSTPDTDIIMEDPIIQSHESSQENHDNPPSQEPLPPLQNIDVHPIRYPEYNLLCQLEAETFGQEPPEPVRVFAVFGPQTLKEPPRPTLGDEECPEPETTHSSMQIHLGMLSGIREAIYSGLCHTAIQLSTPFWRKYLQEGPASHPSFHYFCHHCDLFPFVQTETTVCPAQMECPANYFPSPLELNPLLTYEESEFFHHAIQIFRLRERNVLANSIQAVLTMRFRQTTTVAKLFAEGYLQPYSHPFLHRHLEI